MITTIDELFANTSPEPNTGCWLWMGGSRGEYGTLTFRGRSRVPAHRAAHEAVLGPIHDDWVVDHRCGEKLCINPAHLEQVPHRENGRRGQPQKDVGRGRFVAHRQMKDTARTETFLIRMSLHERARLDVAAEEAGLGLGTWLRDLGLKEAERMQKASEPVQPVPDRTMNRHGAKAMKHWFRWLPKRYSQIEDPQAFFTELGEEIQAQIEELTSAIAGDDPPGESYWDKVGRLGMAGLIAESEVLRELALLPPESDGDPDENDT